MARVEKLGWRDEALSRRHRDYWGFDCPAVDVDFLMVEYDSGKAVAIIDYKHQHADVVDANHASFRALTWLAEPRQLPVLVVYYWPGVWMFRAQPLNRAAAAYVREVEFLTEAEYVGRLYRMRGRSVPDIVLARLNTRLLPGLREDAAV